MKDLMLKFANSCKGGIKLILKLLHCMSHINSCAADISFIVFKRRKLKLV